MAKVIKISYTLELSEEEARWLKEVMQNPLEPVEELSEEDPYQREMRKKIWDALEEVQV